jgi:hypothetical protein
MADRIRVESVAVAQLTGRLRLGAKQVGQLKGRLDTELTSTALASHAVYQAIQDFSRSWKYRRRWFVEEIEALAAAADGFARSIAQADTLTADFLSDVEKQGARGVQDK